ncbi:MAG: hypothetical protein WC627_06065 [Legionella sp.]|jgi:2-polyprenyl-6-methoxyphenol hydroxylase-like FAD-dependent oxidoreductase
MTSKADVVIIGGGPIGLAHAWGVKKLNPKLNVVVLEKYEEYQRRHTLVMQHERLSELMNATNTQQDPALIELLKQLKTDPNIRTNSLEKIFKDLAKTSGVAIINQEVKKDAIKQQIFAEYPDAKLIIGADGTHSVVSETLFPAGNQIKHKFDYVLQLRYEILGEYKATTPELIAFYQLMTKQGLIANEYVGRYEKGKTPVTMQMMISEEDFISLQNAPSKMPIRLYDNKEDTRKNELNPKLAGFIRKYIAKKIAACESNEIEIENNEVRISVNEAPATHAKEVSCYHKNTPLILVGDAGLGLSYFKGLNAGLESSAKLLSLMKSSIQNGFNDQELTKKSLSQYQQWFISDFAPRKVKEVEHYSTWVIRSSMWFAKAVRNITNASHAVDWFEPDAIVQDYFNLFAKYSIGKNGNKWSPYPHRKYDLVELGRWEYVPIAYTFKRIGKLFLDFFKPYKSRMQLVHNFKEPLAGLNNLLFGIVKIPYGLLSLNLYNFADGLARTLQGIIQIATLPLSFVVKPILRGIITFFSDTRNIEDNAGIQKWAHYGEETLQECAEEKFIPEGAYYSLALCNDIHRKFEKSLDRGQSTSLKSQELTCYNSLRSDGKVTREKLHNYFGLFTNKKPVTESNSDSEQLARMTQ